MTAIHIVGGEKGGVGKSVMARLLCQYHIDNTKRFLAFDGDRSHPALLNSYADFSRPLDLESYESCDAIIAEANDGSNIVVDLPAQSERLLRRWFDDSDVAEAAGELGINIVRWHLIDDGVDALRLLEQQLKEQPDLHTVIVRNLGRGRDFATVDASETVRNAMASGRVSHCDLPKLHGTAMNKIDRLGLSLWAAMYNTDARRGSCLGLMERQRVKTWVRRANAQIAAACSSLGIGSVAPDEHEIRRDAWPRVVVGNDATTAPTVNFN
ncbi:MAG: mobilization protein [Deltaproteobacteria bacterium]|nr:mobilization protein [Deltaproteobacteria bacterium]